MQKSNDKMKVNLKIHKLYIKWKENILKLLLKITQKSEINTIINTFIRESQNINDGFFNSAFSIQKPTNSLLKNKKIISAIITALILFITILVYTTNYFLHPKVLKVTTQ